MSLSRRRFLRASGGAILPLPFLASVHGCGTEAQRQAQRNRALGHPLVVVRPASGVVQADGDEPEGFWPRALGPLTVDGLASDNADRVLSELADYADKLLLVRGTRFPFEASREVHSGGGNQLLTGARPGPATPTVMTFAQGESIDNWIARQHLANGGEPLALYAGRRDNYGEEVLSYRGPNDLRGAEDDPWAAYQRLIGTDRQRFASVNDLVLDQLHALDSSPKLAAEDRRRLDQHTQSVREFEVLAGRLSMEIEEQMRDVAGRTTQDDKVLEVAELHFHLIALCFATGHVRAVTLQIGDRLDNGQYVIDGQRLPSYHTISHRNVEPAELGRFASARQMHAAINRLHLRTFRSLLDRLEEQEVLDRSVAVCVSDVATGTHRYDQVPWIIAGQGDGTLRRGVYVDAGDVPHNHLLATLLTATGHRDDDGGPITRFGDPEIPPGLVSAMMTS